MVAKVENILNLRKKSKISNFGRHIKEKFNTPMNVRHSTSSSPIKKKIQNQYAFSSLTEMIKELNRKINYFREKEFLENSKNENYSNVPEVSNELMDMDMDENSIKYSKNESPSNKRINNGKNLHSNKINLNLNLNIMVNNVDNIHNKSYSTRENQANNNYTIAESLIEDSKLKHPYNDLSK
jgi:hypothetical protein